MNPTINRPHGLGACLGNAGLAIHGVTTTQFLTANAVPVVIDGYIYTQAAIATGVMTAADEQAVSTSCLYLITVNASGTVATVKGEEVSTARLTNGVDGLEFPHAADGYVPIGAIRVDTNASTTFTAGTTAFDAAGITDTYYNLATLPSGTIAP